MTVGLFIPCYVDQFYPAVGVAALTVLERLGCTVDFPRAQTCCGQPMGNAGYDRAARDTMRHFVDTFAGYDYVVAPSGSCVLHVRAHYASLEPSDAVRHVRARTYELCHFLVDVLGATDLGASFPHRVGLHEGCHGLRGLRLGRASELNVPDFSTTRRLLAHVAGLELVDLDRPDECCGFGGTFAVTEEAVSVRMGQDRVADHRAHGAEVITSTDLSCLLHLDGLIRREALPIRVVHIAEILAADGERHA